MGHTPIKVPQQVQISMTRGGGAEEIRGGVWMGGKRVFGWRGTHLELEMLVDGDFVGERHVLDRVHGSQKGLERNALRRARCKHGQFEWNRIAFTTRAELMAQGF